LTFMLPYNISDSVILQQSNIFGLSTYQRFSQWSSSVTELAKLSGAVM
jgi:hypothetical protein